MNDDAHDLPEPDDTRLELPAPSVILPGGGLMLAGTIIGEMGYHADGRPQITLNLGWLRLANVAIRVLDDPEVDHHRGGVTLER